MRDVEAVLAAEGEEEVVARDARDLLRLEAEQLPDAVVLVDDEVAGPEVGERGECAAEAAVGARRPLAEDLRVRQEDETELAPDEAAPGGSDREQELGLLRQVLPRLERGARRPAGAGSASGAPRRRAGTRRRRGCRRVTKPFSSVSASARPRAAIAGRCASNENGCACGNGSSSLVPASGISVEPLLGPDAAHLVRLPGEVGHAVEHGNEVVRDLERGRVLVVGERGLDEVGDAARRPGRSPRRRPGAAPAG